MGRTPSLADAERAYLDARDAHDRLDVARALGDSAARARLSPMGDVESLERHAHETRRAAMASVGAIPPAALHGDDRRALAIMQRVLEHDLADMAAASDAPADQTECAYAISAIARGDSALARLRERVYACYTRAVQQVRLDDSTTDRLSVLAALGRERDPVRRRRLFLALDTIWRTVNRDDGRVSSPYRVLVGLEAPQWRSGYSPVDASLAPLGLRADSTERWLVRILERWRDATASAKPIEPWDWWYAAGAAARRLDARLPLTALPDLTERAYASLGASPRALGVHLDLAPRSRKTPVAFTTFGARPRRADGKRTTGEPWIFATYRVGGLDNLNELLHEMGHAVHIAAIDTRPAFTDWPDSDTFTEALAEVLGAEAYDGAWQMRWLGDSATTSENRRARLAPVMLDVAWALFELRMHRDPARDPNVVWTTLTRDYLHIAPHPELSWWAMRGQLIDSPGYMMNYAVGAIITADVRGRASALGGPFSAGLGERWYPWLSARLYRFGLARSSGDVLRDFLGRELSPEALLREIDGLSS